MIDSLASGRDTARFEIRSRLLGILAPGDSGLVFSPGIAERRDTVVAVLTPYGWRLSGQVGLLGMYPSSAHKQLRLSEADRARIDSAVAAFRSRAP